MYELAKTDTISFHFVNGPIETPAATGVAKQYKGPYYRFLDSRLLHPTQVKFEAKPISRQTQSPEDHCRHLREMGGRGVGSSTACDFVQQYAEYHDGGPYDGILGFSEGASVAAKLILRQSTEKSQCPFKFAIFVCAIPVFRLDEDILLADETDERIQIPTAHIVGSKDVFQLASKSLYNLCHQPSASIFEHSGTHTIPWDPMSTRAIAKEIRSVVERSCSGPSTYEEDTLLGNGIKAQRSML